MIPTIFRAKLPQTLSHPLKAKMLTAAFADVPQLEMLKIWFSSPGKQARASAQQYEVCSITYYWRLPDRFDSHHSEQYGYIHKGWRIWVEPVPRAQKHTITRLLLAEGLPRAREWLHQHRNLTGHEGSRGLKIFFREGTEALSFDEYSQIVAQKHQRT